MLNSLPLATQHSGETFLDKRGIKFQLMKFSSNLFGKALLLPGLGVFAVQQKLVLYKIAALILGVLVINVTWRGKTYVGTLLDSTRHVNQWAPPRYVKRNLNHF